jgi:hypothetical protein
MEEIVVAGDDKMKEGELWMVNNVRDNFSNKLMILMLWNGYT